MAAHESPDRVFFNGKIVTLDSNNSIFSAVAVKDGEIMAVGADEEIRMMADEASRLIDLKGKTMLPGFIDAHCHLGLTSRSFRHYVDGRCPPNRSIQDILDRIHEKTAKTPKGEWIVVHMSMFGNSKLAEKRYPNRKELDSAAPEHPLYCLASMHTQIANSYALKMANVTKETARALKGVDIELDKTTGEPTGVLVECHDLLPVTQLTYDEMKETLKEGIPEYWVKMGFTSVYSFSDAQDVRIYQDLCKEGNMPLRVRIMPCDLGNSPTYIENLRALGIMTGLGNERLKMGGVKIFVDGAFMALSAASFEPYLGVPERDYCGILRHNARSLNDLALKAHNAGLQLCIHAMGDKAQTMALDAIENALEQNPRPHRHRIEHFGCDMGSSQLRERARALGIVPVVTMGWLFAYGDFIEPYLGPARRNQSFALKSMMEMGLKVANSSDQCGTEPVTLDPFFSIWTAVTRQTYFGNQFVPEEAISINDALRMWTTYAAYSGFEETLKGSIEPGKVADMIVISRDILNVPEAEIKEIKVEMTVVDGEIVYEL